MKVAKLVLVVLWAAAATTQQQSTFLVVSMQRSSFSQANNQMVSDCVLVQSDGSFRREHEDMDMVGRKWSEIYEGKLAAAELNALSAALNDHAFQAIDTPPPTGGLHMVSGETIHINILRPGSAQNLHILDEATRKRYEKTLKPLLAWWKNVEKIKLSKLKNAAATGCQPEVPPTSSR